MIRVTGKGWTLLVALLALALALAAPASASARWKPGPPRYEVGVERSLPVEMADGTTLRADVYFPVDRASGERADGKFPVVMNMTPYGKRSLEFIGSAQAGGDGDAGMARTLPEFVERGYINVIVDVRGTGRSQGTFGLADPQQGRDGAELVRWAAKLPASSGKVGLYGPSYMAIMQYHTAANLPRRSPLKALFPVVAPNQLYREFVTMGGMPAGEADIPLFLIFVGLPLTMPLIDEGWSDVPDTLAALARNVPSLTERLIPLAIDVVSNGDAAYEGRFWRQRSPAQLLRRVAKRRVPVLMTGGWRDVFQRGALMNYAGLQNARAGRDTAAPMPRRRKPSSRYQLIQGDWTHVNAGQGIALGEIAQRWFDTWLKRKRGTGLRRVENPVRLFDMTRQRWIETKRYPLDEPRPRHFYLNRFGVGSDAPSLNKGSLVPRRPRGTGADSLAFTGVSSPCSGTADQYALGTLTLALGSAGLENPCVRDDRTLQIGPGALTYTTEPFPKPRTIAGPIAARILATSTRPEVSLIATLEEVSPSGSTRYLTSGALLGSHRALDRKRSWRLRTSRGREMVLPYHPHTQAAQAPVPVGEIVRYDLEIFPVLATIEPGHSLRLTLTSVDTPHLTPTPEQMSGLIGGVYRIQRNATRASRLTIPMTRPSRLNRRCKICR